MKTDCVLVMNVWLHVFRLIRKELRNNSTREENIINHLPFSSKAHTSREIDSDLHRRGYRPAATKSFNSISTNQLGLTQAERPIMHGKPDNCRHLITWERYLTVDDGGLIRPNYFRSFYFLEIAYIFRKIFDRAA